MRGVAVADGGGGRTQNCDACRGSGAAARKMKRKRKKEKKKREENGEKVDGEPLGNTVFRNPGGKSGRLGLTSRHLCRRHIT